MEFAKLAPVGGYENELAVILRPRNLQQQLNSDLTIAWETIKKPTMP